MKAETKEFIQTYAILGSFAIVIAVASSIYRLEEWQRYRRLQETVRYLERRVAELQTQIREQE